MADNLQSLTILCQGGLDTTDNHLFIDAVKPGAAAELVNYEVGLYGGYRRIEGYGPYDSDYTVIDAANAEGEVLGIAVYKDTSEIDHIFAARKQEATPTYKIYEYTAGVGWTDVAPGFTLNYVGPGGAVTKIRHKTFTFGGVNYIMFVDGANYATLYDGTTWYQITSTGAGTSASPGGDQVLDYPKFIALFENHIFLGGGYGGYEIVCHSAPEDPFNFTAASGGGQLSFGHDVNGLQAFRESLFVFGQERIKRIYVDNVSFVIKDVATNIGCIAPDSIIELNGDVMFFAQDGVRTISGTDKIGDVNLASLSKDIQRYINFLQEEYDLSFLNSAVIKKKSQFRYYISNPNIDSNGVGIIGGLRERDGAVRLEFSKLSGIRTSCVTVAYVNGEETVLHGDYDGGVYQQEFGSSFNGAAISSVYRTPYLTLGDPTVRKLARQLHVFTKPEASFTLGLTTTFDWEDPDIVSVAGYSDTAGEGLATYDGVGIVYDAPGVTYSDESLYPIMLYDVEQSFKSVQFTFTTNEVAKPHSIQGFIIEFSTQGKR